VWLLDQSATLAKPLSRLGAVDAGMLARDAGLALEDGPRLVAALDRASSPGTVMADSAQSARSLVRVTMRRHTP
jgi:hypothetical protein